MDIHVLEPGSLDHAEAGSSSSVPARSADPQLGEEFAGSAAAPPRRTAQHRTARRTSAWLTPTLLLLLLVLSGQPLAAAPSALLLAGMVSAAVVSGSRRASLAAVLPIGFVVVVAWALVWGLLGSLLPWGAWGSRAASIVGLGLLTLGTGMLARRRGGRVVIVGREWLAVVGATALAGFYVAVVVIQPIAWWSRINGAGTDFLRHVGSTRDTLLAGELVIAEPGYPRAIYAIGSLLASALGVPGTASALWRVLAPLGFLMLVLMLLALISIATRTADLVVGRRGWQGPVAGAIAALAFVQTAWFSTFLAFGSVMNILVGVGLLGLLATGLQPSAYGNPIGGLAAGSAVAVTANAWQLMLPVVGLAALPFAVQAVRTHWRSPREWAIWIGAGLLTLNGLLTLRTIVGGYPAAPTVSNLFHPEWWWWPPIALALGTCVVARHRCGWWAASALGALVGGGLLVAGLMLATGSTWELMLYYPVKCLWTAMVVVIPLASAGGVVLVAALWRRGASLGRIGGPVLRGLIGLAVAVGVVACLGRGAAFQPHLAMAAQGRSGAPNWAMGLLEALDGTDLPEERHEGAVVFGLLPEASQAMVAGRGYAGVVDYLAQESLHLRGVTGAINAPVKEGLYNRDMTLVCRYLLDHPNSLRITGPNPAAGVRWLLDSGCPRHVVKPEQWTQVWLAPEWLERSPWEDAAEPWDFPTRREVESASASGR